MPAADEPVRSAEAAALFADLAPSAALVLAVSGGPDSTALLWLAARWRARLKRGPKLVAVTVDHGLRPDSVDEAKAVKRLARELKVEHRTVRWTGTKPATGIQAAARTARYRLLVAAAGRAGARHILTAHTLDDQAETVLIRLSRGSGLTGLAGMAQVTPLDTALSSLPGEPPQRRGLTRQSIVRKKMDARVRPGHDDGLLLVRPFLAIPKTRLLATLRAAKVPFTDDPSNADPRFTRARLRKVMPLMAAEGLDAGKLALLARRAARAEAAIEAAVAQAVASLTQWSNSGPIILDRSAFAELPGEVALRVLGQAIARIGDEGPVALGKLEALFDALGTWRDRDGTRIRRTLAGAVVTLDADRLVVERAPARSRRGQKRLSAGRGLY